MTIGVVALASESFLEGEDPGTQFGQDARHWVAIYRELIVFSTNVLARLQARVRRLPASSRAEATAADVPVIQAQLARYRRRLEFWYERQWALEGLIIDQASRTIVHRDRSVMLTRREQQLFLTLVSRPSSYTRSSQLLAEAWHNAGLPEETLRTYIVRLRAKLDELGIPVRIDNKPRQGYALVFDDPAATRITRQNRE
jgi:DNA-binding response OmpR family regulator